MKKIVVRICVVSFLAIGLVWFMVSAPVFDVNDITVKGKTIRFGSEIVKKWVTKMAMADGKKVLGRADVQALADEFLLTEKTAVNPHLRFDDGDIAFWYEQCKKYKLDEQDLRREFAARRMVLEAADAAGVMIDLKGDLSHAAGQIMADMLRARLDLDGKKK